MMVPLRGLPDRGIAPSDGVVHPETAVQTVHLAHRRSRDVLAPFAARSLVVSLGGRRVLISPTDAHFLLHELNRLPGSRWPAAAPIRERMVAGLSRGWPVTVAETDRATLIRALEGARTRRPLTANLRRLRDSLVPPAVG